MDRLLFPTLLPLAQRIAGDDGLAEGALQNSWIKIMQAVNHACFSGPKACPWVSAIVTNAARDVRRRRLRQGEVPLSEVEGPGRSPEALALEKQLPVLLREIIVLLPGDLPPGLSSCACGRVSPLSRRRSNSTSPARRPRRR